MNENFTRRGARKGAGRKTKDADGVQREAWSGRIHPRTAMFLRALANTTRKSEAEVVDECVEEKCYRTFGDGPPPGWVATHRPPDA
jgi:hypothetical protein